MNIVIDQGNTAVKVALFEDDAYLTTFFFSSLDSEQLSEIIIKYRPQKGIFCTVGNRGEAYIPYLKEHLDFYAELDENTPLPIQLAYRTPSTLGKDRIAGVVGAFFQKPNRNLLVIDSGTAITYDFIDCNGIYHGGNISPGLKMRFQALNHYTKRLPLLDEKGEVPPIGYDTETAIRSGVVTGIVGEMDAYMDEYKEKQDVFTFLTGGDAFYFESKLKNSIFADANLVLKGLNKILNYQYE